MPDPETVTPAAGTDASLTPDPGTQAPITPNQETEQETPAVKRYKEQAAGAQQEAQRRTQEAQRLWAENQRLQAEIARNAPAQRQEPSQSRISVQQYNDAIVEGRHDLQAQFLAQERKAAVEEATNTFRQEYTERERYNQRAGSFTEFMRSTPGLTDAKTGLMQEAVNEYREIMNNPYIPNEERQPNLQLVPPDPITGNPGLAVNQAHFVNAVRMAQAKRANGKAAAADEVRQAGDTFTEPGGQGSGAPPGQKPTHGNKILLTKDEDNLVDRWHKKNPEVTRESYWGSLDPAVKAARQRAGRAE